MTLNRAKMINGVGRLINRKTKTGTKEYDRFFIYVPTDVAHDSMFPFKVRDKVKITIEKNKLIVENI